MSSKLNILIAGIGGASLGTEILKSLLLVKERYRVFGCDISPFAFGHFQNDFESTFFSSEISDEHKAGLMFEFASFLLEEVLYNIYH